MPRDRFKRLLSRLLGERIDPAQGEAPGPITGGEREAVDQAIRRDAELASGDVAGRTHPQVMEAARQLLG